MTVRSNFGRQSILHRLTSLAMAQPRLPPKSLPAKHSLGQVLRLLQANQHRIGCEQYRQAQEQKQLSITLCRIQERAFETGKLSEHITIAGETLISSIAELRTQVEDLKAQDLSGSIEHLNAQVRELKAQDLHSRHAQDQMAPAAPDVLDNRKRKQDIPPTTKRMLRSNKVCRSDRAHCNDRDQP